jgi:hypothetical protein
MDKQKGLSSVFRRMMKCCPLEVAAYGACVTSLGESVDKSACDKQFKALRLCSKKLGKK